MKKIINKAKKNWEIILLCISVIIFTAILEDVLEKDLMKGDLLAYNIIIKYIRCNFLTKIMKVITNIGSAYIIILVTTVLLIVLKNKRKSLCILLNASAITLLNQIIKFLVQRPRPDGYNLIKELGYSFPSGHSMVSMAFYGFLIYLSYKYIKNKNIKIMSIILLSIFILLIGFSRVYLGVHFLSDVLAGFFISIAYLIIFIKLTKSYIDKGEVYEK